MEYKVGIGYDIHRLVEGRRLFLGGVEIPYIKGLYGHSDADSLLHAVCDGLLGALGKGDIGEHFPNTDEKYHNISSLKLLKEVFRLVKEAGFTVNNVDAVVIAEAPHISPFKSEMKTNIAAALEVKPACVNIKATTQEGTAPAGAESIAAYVVVSLRRE
ncbi:MAG: 2-C-methyl-D-erythritol 2,4-cyclodiphosphate synthase [Candidatus Omnitrophota bacterium]